MSDVRLELRCPHQGRTKFGDVLPEAQGFYEVSCRPCRQATAHFDPPLTVLHIFDLSTGACVRTDEVPRDV